MATVSFRVPPELKRRMDAVEENWSAVIRDAIEDRLRKKRRMEAARRMDELRERIFKRTGKYSDGSQLVLRWRRLH